MSFEFSLHTGFQGFQEIKNSWSLLAEAHGSHFLHFPAWYQAELASRDNTGGIFFILASEDASPIGIFPLELTHIKKLGIDLPIVRLFYPNEMGVNDIVSAVPVAQYLIPLTKFMRENLPYFRIFQWQCILQAGHAATANLIFHTSHASKYLDVSEGPDVFWANYSKKFVRNIRRKERKAEKEGTLNLEVINTVADYPRAFKAFLAVEGSGWKGEQGTSIALQADKLRFYQTLLEESASDKSAGKAHINLLTLDGECIAAQFAIRVGSTLYLLKIGFSESVGNISPGALLLAKLIDSYAQTSGLKKISFVTGVGWIDSWHPKSDAVGVSYTSNGQWLNSALVRMLNRQK